MAPVPIKLPDGPTVTSPPRLPARSIVPPAIVVAPAKPLLLPDMNKVPAPSLVSTPPPLIVLA